MVQWRLREAPRPVHRRPGLVLDHRAVPFWIMGGLLFVSLCMVPFLGRDFFPQVDAGQFRLHVRAPAGTRLEATAARFYKVGETIRKVVPASEIHTVLDNIGLPVSGINLSFSDGATIGEADGEILVALNENHHPTADYVRTLRARLKQENPDMEFFFGAADIVSQILNFGISAPSTSRSGATTRLIPRDSITRWPPRSLTRWRAFPAPWTCTCTRWSTARTQGGREPDAGRADWSPAAERRQRRAHLARIQRQAAPNFWLNFKNGVTYNVAVQTPQYRMTTLDELRNTPISLSGTAARNCSATSPPSGAVNPRKSWTITTWRPFSTCSPMPRTRPRRRCR